MILEAIYDLVVASGAANKVFITSMPAGVEEAVLIRSSLGGIDIDHELPNYYRTTIQIIVRHPKRSQGRIISKMLQEALTSQQRFTMTVEGEPMTMNYMLPTTLPIEFPRLDGNGVEWSLNVQIGFCTE